MPGRLLRCSASGVPRLRRTGCRRSEGTGRAEPGRKRRELTLTWRHGAESGAWKSIRPWGARPSWPVRSGAERRAVDRLHEDLSSARWAERNRDLAALDAAELGLRLLVA
ncbi:hypothetical protein GCM10010498_43710 [Streptomyces cavourensis]|nr:hypothetical protein GCM10010498_43710 [Streptomyces cavourensis]